MENFIYIALGLVSVMFLAYLWKENKKSNQPISRQPLSESDAKVSFVLRIQAYERLTLFLERSKPQSLLMRLMDKTDDKQKLQLLILNTIREEFEHNFSQQIYISESLWQMISLAKDRLIQLINKAATSEKVTTAQTLSEELLLQYADEKEDFIEIALQMLRKEARMIQGQ